MEPEPYYDSNEDPEKKEDKIRLKDIKPLNVWDIIDTYFRDTSYYKTQHQNNDIQDAKFNFLGCKNEKNS